MTQLLPPVPISVRIGRGKSRHETERKARRAPAPIGQPCHISLPHDGDIVPKDSVRRQTTAPPAVCHNNGRRHRRRAAPVCTPFAKYRTLLLPGGRIRSSVQKRFRSPWRANPALRGEAFRPPRRGVSFSVEGLVLSSRRGVEPLHGEALPTLHGERVDSPRRMKQVSREKVSSQHGEQTNSTRRKNQVSV